MRPGRAFLGATNDGTEPPQAAAGEDAVVTETVAAFLVRQRAAVIVEIIEPSEDVPEAE
jgi:hypothetical protein